MNDNPVVSPDIITRYDLEHLIATFYGRVFADEQIGLFFSLVAHVTPQTHFPLMADFWELALFGRNGNPYHHNFIEKHVELHLKHALEPHHVKRWTDLFCLTVEDLFNGPTAEAAKVRARLLTMALQTNKPFVDDPLRSERVRGNFIPCRGARVKAGRRTRGVAKQSLPKQPLGNILSAPPEFCQGPA